MFQKLEIFLTPYLAVVVSMSREVIKSTHHLQCLLSRNHFIPSHSDIAGSKEADVVASRGSMMNASNIDQSTNIEKS